MRRNEAGKNRKNHTARFVPVFDTSKRKIKGLVQRGTKYYAQMRIATPDGHTRPVRIPLEATRLDDAKAEAEAKRTENRKGKMHLPGLRPKFKDLVEKYRKSAQFIGKKQGTRENETQALNRWLADLGAVRVDWIKTERMVSFRDARRQQGASARTVNLDLVAFNNAMSYAVERGWITAAPRLKKLEEPEPVRRRLLTAGEIDSLLRACTPTVTKNARELQFYIRFLVLTGAREREKL